MTQTPLTLASASKSRQALLAAAGVDAAAMPSRVDEDVAKAGMREQGVSVAAQAMALAELKAKDISKAHSGLVIGGDQMLGLGDRAFDKPKSVEEARGHLEALSGQSHRLETALVVCEHEEVVWRHLSRPKLTMRPLSSSFIDRYLDEVGDRVLSTVGGYQLESLGVQLFSEIEGDYFSILGLPLLPLLEFLRQRGVLEQ
ncbi:MAG: Maf family protein [Pseudomonadota bacterium]